MSPGYTPRTSMPVPVRVNAEAMQQHQEEMVVSGRELNPMVLAWFKSEFAAANAIIDDLCAHILQLSKMQQQQQVSDDYHIHHCDNYKEVFSAIHRRRMNWIPILHMQKYLSIPDVSIQLQRVLDKKQRESPNSISNGHHQPNQLQQQSTIGHPCGCCCKKEEEDKDGQVELIKKEGEDTKVLQLQRHEDQKDRDSLQGGCSRKSTSSNPVTIDVNPPSECEDGTPTTISTGHNNTTANDTHSARSSQEDDRSSPENFSLCSDHEECMTRRERINTLKGFRAKESIKGRRVNVVKGMKVYEGVFTDLELLKLGDYIKELRATGQNGHLPGETYIFFNKELKGNKREIIQLGIPLFQTTNGKATSTIEPIPLILQDVINHLLQWRLLPQSKQPNSCIINFFDEEEHSQPYFKPPHLDNPISTLFLHETTMAFGRALMSDNNGNFKGSLTVSLKQGSFLVLKGNGADKATHVVCPSGNARVSITFARVRPSPSIQQPDFSASPTKSVVAPLWMPDDDCGALGCHGVVPTTWGVAMQAAPILMLAPSLEPIIPMTLVDGSPITAANGQTGHDVQNDVSIGGIGTGVYLPWSMGDSKKLLKRIPPCFQKARPSVPPPSSLPPSLGTQVPMGKGSSPVSCPLS